MVLPNNKGKTFNQCLILDHAKTFKLFKSNSHLAQCGFFLKCSLKHKPKQFLKNYTWYRHSQTPTLFKCSQKWGLHIKQTDQKLSSGHRKDHSSFLVLRKHQLQLSGERDSSPLCHHGFWAAFNVRSQSL